MKSIPRLTRTTSKGLPTSDQQFARTIRTGGGHSMDNKHTLDIYMIKGKIRRLTPTECERLMSWPNGHTKYGVNEKGEKVEISDSQRYKMCGNGVVSKVVEHIARELFITCLKNATLN